jgi:predicted ester cyclase
MGTSRAGEVQRNKEIFRRFQQEVFNAGDFRIEALAKYLSKDFIDHTARPHDPPGLEGVRQRYLDGQSAFSRATETSREVIGEEDLVAILYDTTSTHSGSYMGVPPTEQRVTIPGLKILRFEDGLIAEQWSIYDYLTTAYQIGAEIEFTPRSNGVAGAEESAGRTIAPARRRLSPGLSAPTPGQDVSEADKHRQILYGFQRDVFNKSDWSIPTLAKYLKPNIIDHNAFIGDPPGLEGVQSRFSLWKSAFGEATEEYQATVAEGDKLACLYDLHAEHTGAYFGIPPTNRPVTIPGIELLRFEDGMIAEHWGIYDFEATAREIGARMTFLSRASQSMAG